MNLGIHTSAKQIIIIKRTLGFGLLFYRNSIAYYALKML